MPGTSPYEAYNAFVTPLASALSCIGKAKIQPSAGGKNDLGIEHGVYITGTDGDGFITLKGTPRLQFRARMKYMIIEDPRDGYGPYRVTTKAYDYSLRLASGEKILDFHWHPNGPSHEARPHLHIGTAQLSPLGVIQKASHLLSGRMTFENVVRSAVQFGAKPQHADWEKRLDRGEATHMQYRSWS